MHKHILLIIAGEQAQQVTQTLWASACDGNNHDAQVPDEIYVIGTDNALNQIRSNLLNDKIYQRFINEYPVLQNLPFSRANLLAISKPDQKAVYNIETPEDNELARNYIANTIQLFAEQENVTLHVAMTDTPSPCNLYALMALTQFARENDRLFYVQVEAKYKNATNFYYPSSHSEHYVSNKEHRVLGRSQQGRIFLNEVPFCRLHTNTARIENMGNRHEPTAYIAI